MRSGRLTRVIAAVVGGSAIMVMVVLTASCAKEEETAPETSTTTTTTTTSHCDARAAASVEPTEKAITPHGRQSVHTAGEGAAGANRSSWR